MPASVQTAIHMAEREKYMRISAVRVLVVLAFLGMLAAHPASACFCQLNFQSTGNTWGFGATCTDAHNNMVANAQAAAAAACENGVCGFGAVTINWGCQTSTMEPHVGEKQEDGQIQFKCTICGPGGGGGGGGGGGVGANPAEEQ